MENDDAVGGWSSPGSFNGMDTIFWRIGADPRLRVDVQWTWFLAQAPEWRNFHACCEWVVSKLPRLTHRVVDSGFGVGIPRWELDTDFRLNRHVHRMRLPEPGGLRELLDLMEWRGLSHFDPEHPPWECVLIEGYLGDRAAIALRWHHCVSDAVGVIGVLQRLLAVDPARRSAVARPSEVGATTLAARPGSADRLALTARGVVWAAAQALTALLDETRRWADAPRSTAERARHLIRSMERTFAPVRPSPLLRTRSVERHCDMMTVPLPELKSAGKTAGVSVTSAYTAAVLGALHRYHDHFGQPRRYLPVVMPVNVRAPEQTGGGNVIAAVRIAGPIGDMSPQERMMRLHRSVSRARAELVDEIYPLLADLGGCVPGALLGVIAPILLRSVDVWVTSVPGLTGPVYAAGAEIIDTVAWAPRGWTAANFTMVSHGETCAIGSNLDPAAITETALFHRCLRQSFDEMFTSCL